MHIHVAPINKGVTNNILMVAKGTTGVETDIVNKDPTPVKSNGQTVAAYFIKDTAVPPVVVRALLATPVHRADFNRGDAAACDVTQCCIAML
jgi:hypothetical protein